MQGLLWNDVGRVRAEAPLVHNITNFVAMNFTANALLAVGASPVMAHAMEEMDEMTGLARALVLNIGTLSSAWVPSMQAAARKAKQKGAPIVLDPVGAGATRYRTQTALDLLALSAPCIVRGNASEVLALATATHSTKGVDSTQAPEAALEAAHFLVKRHDCVVSISGATDIIVSAGRVVRSSHGHPWMAGTTAMGCVASALTGAFAAVNDSLEQAALHAMVVMGIAGEKAAQQSHGPGSFPVAFLDALYALKSEDFDHLRVEEG